MAVARNNRRKIRAEHAVKVFVMPLAPHKNTQLQRIAVDRGRTQPERKRGKEGAGLGPAC